MASAAGPDGSLSRPGAKIELPTGHDAGVSADPIDDQQFRALFDAHFADLWRFARRRCSSPEAADDVVAEVFAVAWRRRDDLPECQERLWLFGVARNVVSNERRSTDRRLRLRSKLAAARQTPQREQPETEAAAERIEGPLAALSPTELEAVQLRYWDELAVADIATLLECTPNAVSMRLHSARRKLERALDDKDPASDGHVPVEPNAGGTVSDGHR